MPDEDLRMKGGAHADPMNFIGERQFHD